jgi:hypothetical protein
VPTNSDENVREFYRKQGEEREPVRLNSAENVREFYRKQGEQRELERILQILWDFDVNPLVIAEVQVKK